MSKIKRIQSLFLAACMLVNMLQMWAGAIAFKDTEGHWAKSAIERWIDYGILAGDQNGDFQPDAPITRGALAKIIAEAMKYKVQAENTYIDLPADVWYTPYVLKCVTAGVMNGYGGRRMGPEDLVTRQEACKMLSVAFGLAPETSADTQFTDQAVIADWALPYVAAMAKKGYITGIGADRFAPELNMNRASVVTVLNNVVAEYIQESGTYTGGKDGIVIVVADGAVIRDARVRGNLLIHADNVKVERVTVEGNLIISGNKTNVQGGQVTGDVVVEASAEDAKLTDTKVSGEIRGDAEITKSGSSHTGGEVSEPEPEESGALSLNWNTYAMTCGKDNNNGETLTLSASYDKGAYTAPEVRWSSTDDAIVAPQSTTGDLITVQSKTTGLVDITASLYDGDELIDSEVCRITTIDGYDRPTIESLSLSTSELMLSAGGVAVDIIPIFFPVDIPSDGKLDTALEVAEGYDTNVVNITTVRSNYSEYADVGELAPKTAQLYYDKIVVTPKSVGKTTFTVKSKVNGRTASCKVTVTEEDLGITGLIGGSDEAVELTVGETNKNTAQLSVTPEGGASDIVWTSSNAHIASVDQNGLVTARSTSNYEERRDNSSALDADDTNFRTVTITATSVKGGFAQQFKIMVLPQAVRPTGISINKSRLNLVAGTNGYLTASVNPASILSPDVQWASSNENVLEVERVENTIFGAPQAKLTPKTAGAATVTVSYAGLSATCAVTITAGEVRASSVKLPDAYTLVVDRVDQLKPEVTTNATEQKLVWLSSDRQVVTVNQEGMIMGHNADETEEDLTATIYAISRDSLTQEQMEQIFFIADLTKNASEQGPAGTELSDIRSLSASAERMEELDAILASDGVVYDSCEITVQNPSHYLRNLHIPEETVTYNSVALLWNRASLYFANELEGSKVAVNGMEVASLSSEMGYTVKNLKPNTAYTFTVTTYYGGGKSVSETVTQRTKAAPVRVLNVLDYGAVGDGSTMDTAAIQRAIDECPVGGEVVLPANHVFYSGALFLKSDMTFRVDGILLGSTDPKDYPRIVSRWEGWRKIYQPNADWKDETKCEGTGKDNGSLDNEYVYSSLLTVGVYDEGEDGYTASYNTENVTICGEGQINANGYRLAYNEGANSAMFYGPNADSSILRSNQTVRGHTLVTHNVKNLYVADVMIANAPAWTIDLIYSDSVTLDNVSIVSLSNYKTDVNSRNYILNGDGCDVDSSTNVNIVDSFFRAGDDAIAAKSGKNREGWLRGKPTAYLRVTDVYSLGSRYGLIIGSEMAGGAHDILFQNNEFRDNVSDASMWIKAPMERGGLVENIIYRDIYNNSTKQAIYASPDYSDSYKNTAAPVYTRIRRLTYDNVWDRSGAAASKFVGKSNSLIRDVVIRGSKFASDVSLKYMDGVQIIDTKPGYKNDGNISNLTVVSVEILRDVDIKPASGIVDVKTIDLTAATISVRKGITVAQLLTQIGPNKASDGDQQYAVTDVAGAAKGDDAELATGDKLTVIAKNGTDTKIYTVQIYKENEVVSSTEVETIVGGKVASIAGGVISVKKGITAAELKAGIRSMLGGAQAYMLYASEEDANAAQNVLNDSAALRNGSCLLVTAEDGTTTKLYKVEEQLVTVTINLLAFTMPSAYGTKAGGAQSEAPMGLSSIKANSDYFQVLVDDGSKIVEGTYFEFDIQISQTATYTGELTGKFTSGRGIYRVSLIPSEDGDAIELGEANTAKTGVLGGVEARIAAGSYKLRFTYQGPSSGTGHFTVKTLVLTPKAGSGGDSGDEPNSGDGPDLTNLAWNKTVTVSGEDASRKGGQTPGMAVDGIVEESAPSGGWDYANGWKSQVPADADDNPWIRIDLGAVHQLDSLKIFWEMKDTRKYRYAVEVSGDGVAYTEVVDRRNNVDYHQTVDMLNTSARYIKVTVFDCVDKSNRIQETTVVTIRELEIYGE